MERSPKTIVVDASTATKWFVEETDSDKANLLKTAHESGLLQLTAPDLLVYEVTNALDFNPKMTIDDLVHSTRRLLELDLDLVPPRADFIAETARSCTGNCRERNGSSCSARSAENGAYPKHCKYNSLAEGTSDR